jgi:hypothetical protein
VTIGNGVTNVGESTFSHCSYLTEIILPKGMHTIGENAFYDCPKLRTVYHKGSQADWSSIVINSGNDCLKDATIIHDYCDHIWSEGAVTKEATCKETGIKTYTCTICGGTKTETIAKLTTHSYDNGVETKAPTCKETGVKTITCSVCGDSYTEEIPVLTEHSYVDGACTVCGSEDPDYVAPTEPTEPTDPADPTEPTNPSDPTEPTEPDANEEEPGALVVFFAEFIKFFFSIISSLFSFLFGK